MAEWWGANSAGLALRPAGEPMGARSRARLHATDGGQPAPADSPLVPRRPERSSVSCADRVQFLWFSYLADIGFDNRINRHFRLVTVRGCYWYSARSFEEQI